MDIQLGKRLQLLARIIHSQHSRTPYDQVWDCCCDHGLLGRYLLTREIGKQVHFVDRVADIMALLPPLLTHIDSSRYQLLTQDAATLRLKSGPRHAVIIAGIGGELATSMLDAIVTNNPDATVDFLLCPNNSIFDLRDYLAGGPFTLLHEQLIKERKWFYEAILVRKGSEGKQVSVTGEFWEKNNRDHAEYMQRLMGHCNSLLHSSDKELARERIERYSAFTE
ncbi:tRNA (adenine(22)-N(1))-methyltransferase TrmK [Simiduia aestuariiviva]|uniref:tRNA (Adenine22-N1)-methyltransferase n=1 Tax=Simiduia aestuariiviva TaxID=1510459 RepID=A0A839UPK7_9GAMM|nr:tRNA (adenine(22)-N(1))-methyltransferase TrmK [Simiduia aestuariiviva]MBB3167478.1 tRNA (adenine22-N1)-methyltransferase [Simiduia aestuariiviva]